MVAAAPTFNVSRGTFVRGLLLIFHQKIIIPAKLFLLQDFADCSAKFWGIIADSLQIHGFIARKERNLAIFCYFLNKFALDRLTFVYYNSIVGSLEMSVLSDVAAGIGSAASECIFRTVCAGFGCDFAAGERIFGRFRFKNLNFSGGKSNEFN